ncbi:MAG: glutamine amidotransferase-related protein [Mycobacteriaceae bacterium]|uniref:glutamine amidotransferase-related protein n=1 Tax=Corynebacterium sp. TaxID=1720 RepID=UPI003F9EAD6E
MTTSPLTSVVLRFLAFEDAGVWEDVLHPTYADVGVDFPPGPLEADLLVVMGGPVSTADPRYPYLDEVVDLIRSRHAAGRPVLGVCLGAQLLAVALGGRIVPGAGPMQIGWSPVTLTEAGLEGPLRHLEGRPVLHWHGDRIELPDGKSAMASGVERLAYDDDSPVQAFQSNHALGLQFHPEVDPSRIEQWLIGHASDLTSQDVDLDSLRADTEEYGPGLVEPTCQVVVDWLRTTGIAD